mmetsp:Transcript_24991/g.58203  ORF Transcript_24991/g.58203 Transcript_24991/m.58203 type:complete len:84 (+) Transcript_24991:128-379(+)
MQPKESEPIGISWRLWIAKDKNQALVVSKCFMSRFVLVSLTTRRRGHSNYDQQGLYPLFFCSLSHTPKASVRPDKGAERDRFL